MPDATPLLGDAQALRDALEQEGFLWLRSVLDTGAVEALRSAYFRSLDPRLLRSDRPVGEGWSSGVLPTDIPGHGLRGHPAWNFARSEDLNRLIDGEALHQLASSILAASAIALPRRIVRQFNRSRPIASRAHADWTYSDRGSSRVLTVWIPLGHCPLEAGGLVYLERSAGLVPAECRAGLPPSALPADARPITSDLDALARVTGRRWLGTDVAAGDILVHTPHIIHASLDPRSDYMRLSVDVRFQPRDEPRDSRWMAAWSADDGY